MGFTPSSQLEADLLRNFKATVAGKHLIDVCDGVRWRWSKSEVFSIKSLYFFLQDSGVADKRFVQLWKVNLPLKVKIFVWLVLRWRALTDDILLKRGWNGASNCVLCLGAIETADHLFVGCVFTNTLLATLLPNKAAVRASTGVQSLWEASELKIGTLGRRELLSIAAT